MSDQNEPRPLSAEQEDEHETTLEEILPPDDEDTPLPPLGEELEAD
jgi:hypothetical protein